MSEAELQLLKQISDTLGHLNKRMEAQEAISRQTLAGLARLEERSINSGKLEERIAKLEDQLSQRLNNHADRLRDVETSVNGAGLAAGWAAKAWPIVGGILSGAAAYLGLNHS